MSLSKAQVMEIRAELQHNAGLFREPRSYIAGVEDALAAVRRSLAAPKQDLHVVADRRRRPASARML